MVDENAISISHGFPQPSSPLPPCLLQRASSTVFTAVFSSYLFDSTGSYPATPQHLAKARHCNTRLSHTHSKQFLYHPSPGLCLCCSSACHVLFWKLQQDLFQACHCNLRQMPPSMLVTDRPRITLLCFLTGRLRDMSCLFCVHLSSLRRTRESWMCLLSFAGEQG